MKWDRYAPSVIPLWVADMDFESPPCVIEAMNNRVNHGIYGYPSEPKDFKTNIVNYVKKHYDWEIEENWIVIIPSVVSALYSIAINCTKILHTLLLQNRFIITSDWRQSSLREILMKLSLKL